MTYDLIVIGTGPGGYVCAIRAAQLGLRVAVVEKRATHGGTCLNVGCIPTKVLLHSVELFTAIKKASHLGIVAEKVSVDWNALMKRKEKVVDHLTGGVGILLKSNDVEVIDGFAKFLSPRSVGVKLKDGGETRIEADSFIIATGSEPVIPAIRGLIFQVLLPAMRP